MTQPFKIGILVGHSLATPLEEAVELAKSAANDFRASGLSLDLWVDAASIASLRRLAEEHCELLLFYGHGTEDGKLVFTDGIHDWKKLSADEQLTSFWTELNGVMLMACHSVTFASSLPCPWLAFGDKILRIAPKGFIHALVKSMKKQTLATAIQSAHKSCTKAMQSNFADDLQLSANAWPERQLQPGTPRIRRGSPALFETVETDIASVSLDGKLYPEHDPFVGRLKDLQTLLNLPSKDNDKHLVQRFWVSGDAGIGKSAFLRQHACNVRDQVFADAEERVWLLHAYCMNCIQPRDLEKLVCEKARRLYNLETTPESLERLFRQLTDISGTHVWVLDDLTYLRPEIGKEKEATHVGQSIADAARTAAVALQLVISARFVGPGEWSPLKVEHLTEPEAVELASRVRLQAQLGMTKQDQLDARLLFARCGMSTVHFKRALLLACERQVSFAAVVNELETMGNLDALDEEEFSRKMVEVEINQLDAIAARHGFNYREFLSVYFPVIQRSGHFSSVELTDWFSDRFLASGTKLPVDRSIRNGLTQLVRLGFLATRSTDGTDVYYMPPNQRVVMKSISAVGPILPKVIPFRAPMSRLSIALERVGKGDLESLGEILSLEDEYLSHIGEIEAAQTVVHAMLIRAELAGLNDSETEICVYDQIVTRFGDREEAALAEHVAKAMFGLLAASVKSGNMARARELAESIIARFEHYPEPGIQQIVELARNLLQSFES